MSISSNINIRMATIDDASILSAISNGVWLDTYATNGMNATLAEYMATELSEKVFRDCLTDRRNYFILAESNHHILGFIQLTVDEPCILKKESKVEIAKLYILRRFQNLGIGKRLIDAGEGFCIHKNYKSLWLSCWCHNHQAINFYEKQGFIKVGEVIIKIRDIDSPNIIFCLTF